MVCLTANDRFGVYSRPPLTVESTAALLLETANCGRSLLASQLLEIPTKTFLDLLLFPLMSAFETFSKDFPRTTFLERTAVIPNRLILPTVNSYSRPGAAGQDMREITDFVTLM